MEKIREKGITLIETVVAIALVVLISVSVLFTFSFSTSTEKKYEIENFFLVQAESASMLYYHSDSESEFESGFNLYSGLTPSEYLEYEYADDEITKTSISAYYSNTFNFIKIAEKESADYTLVIDLGENKKITCMSKSGNIICERGL